ncbi:MAG: SAM-dependent methyltransferase [Marmoricola sp.]
MTDKRASYGVDAPLVPTAFGVACLVFAVVLVNNVTGAGGVVAVIWPAVMTTGAGVSLALYLHSSLKGKFEVWTGLLAHLRLPATAQVVDLGCGRGAVLLAAARHLDAGGRATGVDLWRSVDQSGNSQDATLANARAEGVDARVELHTGDLRDLPFGDASFDVVLVSVSNSGQKSDDSF